MAASMDNDAPDVNLTPLLDVVLQLIMFFMITVNFVSTEHINEDIVLPVAQSAAVLENSPDFKIYLNLNAHGKLSGQLESLDTPGKITRHLRIERERIEREARELNLENPKIVVILRAHKDARYGQIWTILDTCTGAGMEHWQLRVMTKT